MLFLIHVVKRLTELKVLQLENRIVDQIYAHVEAPNLATNFMCLNNISYS